MVYQLLGNRKLRVVLEGQSSNLFDTSAGVPQGSILGPLLFLIYIDDIVQGIETNVSLYADDTWLYVEMDATDHDNKNKMINRDIEKIQRWSEF